jgi:Zn-dependent peptidase ImmA (M78 family)
MIVWEFHPGQRQVLMTDFTATDEIVRKISEQFGVTKTDVETFRNFFYQSIVANMKRQYLAHVIRTMEDKLREIPGNEMFRIVCSPVEEGARDIGIAGAHYYKGRYFAIFYHPSTEEKHLRIMLAHELGHLFLIEFLNSQFGRNYTESTLIEPFSTILGIFTILDKNDFYHNRTGPFKHKSPEAVLHDFSLLTNREAEKLNIS